MSIFLGHLQKVSDTDYIVNYINNYPFDPIHGEGKTEEELNQIGVVIDTIPEPEYHPDKTTITHVNPTTKEVTYTYETPIDPIAVQVQNLQAQNDQLTLTILQIQAKVGA